MDALTLDASRADAAVSATGEQAGRADPRRAVEGRRGAAGRAPAVRAAADLAGDPAPGRGRAGRTGPGLAPAGRRHLCHHADPAPAQRPDQFQRDAAHQGLRARHALAGAAAASGAWRRDPAAGPVAGCGGGLADPPAQRRRPGHGLRACGVAAAHRRRPAADRRFALQLPGRAGHPGGARCSTSARSICPRGWPNACA